MTTNKKLLRTTQYLSDIEQLFFNMGEKANLTGEENNIRKNLHKWAYEFINKCHKEKEKIAETIIEEHGFNVQINGEQYTVTEYVSEEEENGNEC